MPKEETTTGTSESSPWASPWTVLAGVFLLILIAAGVVIVAIHPGGSSKPAPQKQVVATATSPAGTNSSTKKASATGCSLPAGSQAVPSVSPPAGTSWETVGAMSVPQAPKTLGPQRTSGVWNTCFAHSPSGALLAALNFYAEGSAEPSGKVYAKLAVNVPAAALKTRADEATGVGKLQIAGYKYDAYTSHEARISVVVQGPHGALEAVVTPMVWTGSDWRYDFPPNGVPNMEVLQETTLTPPYVTWSDF